MLPLLLTLALLGFACCVGYFLETNHSKRLEQREKEFERIKATTLETCPPNLEIDAAVLTTGHIVIVPSYWRRFLASFRAFFGGEVRSVQFEIQRGRREAIVRMKKDAASKGCQFIINTRIETSMLSSSDGNGGMGTMELLAYGTALRIRNL
jgi:uncharacterized protein YbjQ (UPF0145 family)